MMETGHPEDKANAESCRLASQAWQDIAMFNQRPDLVDDNGNEIEYDPEATIADIQARWDDYCRTGIVISDVDELAENIRDAHKGWIAKQKIWLESKAKEDRAKALLASPSSVVQDAPTATQDSKTAQTSSQKRKDRQKSPEASNVVSAESSELSQSEQPSVSEQSKEPELEKIDEENKKYIQLDAIDFVIAEIRSELGIEHELAELAAV